ncbi:glycosyltransferase family 2 protein [Priestia megaterium]|uniref:glycosyltransferase family 2 protein n=1 Tax=Priestia megaterium TaxID=1404 RepID=UPI001C212065|nr:glycosyltransferase family 2 protein [Priestia megaterium]MBU8752326.1 glycosyltransferase family 2 protein [Priestia megaterium]
MPKLSILIPAYNAEKYISKCLDTVLLQPYKDLEVIVIDDNSSDKTLNILQKYENKHLVLKVIHNSTNRGVVKVRNDLLNKCSGEYIMFCDADDFMEQNAITLAINNMENQSVDLVVFNYKMKKKGFTIKSREKFMAQRKYEKRDLISSHVKHLKTLYWGVLWNKCYKKSIITEHQLSFQEGIEDIMFNIQYMSKINSVYILNEYLYNYNQTNISLTRNSNKLLNNPLQNFEDSYNKWLKYKKVYNMLLSEYINDNLNMKDYAFKYLYDTYLNINNSYRNEKFIEYVNKDAEYKSAIKYLGYKIHIIKFNFLLSNFQKTCKKLVRKNISFLMSFALKKNNI